MSDTPASPTMSELMGKGPALSATSDIPVIAPAIEKEPVSTPEITAEAETVKVEDKAKLETEHKGEESKKDETPGWMKGEITKERNRRREAESRTQKLEHDLSLALESAAAANRAKVESEASVDTTPRPSRGQFDNPDAYDEALIQWSSDKASRVTSAKAEQRRVESEQTEQTKQRDDSAQKAQAEMAKGWNEKRAKAIEKYPDFELVAESDDVTISTAMAHALVQSESGPEIAYHLGKNPKEAERIASLSPVRQAIEIGKIEMRLADKPVSRTPEPITPVGARSRATQKTPAEESMSEYAARRKVELRTRS